MAERRLARHPCRADPYAMPTLGLPKSQLVSFSLSRHDRSHAPRGNAAHDAARHLDAERPGRHSTRSVGTINDDAVDLDPVLDLDLRTR
jgi:hypothetical protein